MSLRNSERVVSDICSSEQMVLFELCEPVSLCDFLKLVHFLTDFLHSVTF